MRPYVAVPVVSVLASALVGAGLGGVWGGVLATTPATASARTNLECFAYVPGVTMRGVPATFRYDDGVTVTETRGPDGLGFQPRDVALPHHPDAGAAATARRPAEVTSHWFTLSGPQLREVTEVDRRDAHGMLVSADYRTRVVRKNWAGARQMSIGQDRDHLYVLTNDDELLRYRLTGTEGNASARLDEVVGTGFGTIGTFEYARTDADAGSGTGPSDVFLATDADTGELMELAIPLDDPKAYTHTVLQTSGWTDMRSVGRLASCHNPTNGRSYDGIVAVDLEGSVRLWTDRDSRDGRGDDIVARGVLKEAWKPLPYSD